MDRREEEFLRETGVKAMRCKERQQPDSGRLAGISWGFTVLAALSCGLAGEATGSVSPGLEEAFVAVQDCMARSPAPWPDAWQREYLDTIRRAAAARPDGAQYAERLAVLSRVFWDYWEGL